MIAVPIREKTNKALIDQIKSAQKTADIIEIWFDELNEKPDLKEIFKAIKKPVIYKTTKNINYDVLKIGIEYIDIDISEAKKEIDNIKKQYKDTKIIVSFHDFQKTPTRSQIKKIIREMLKKGADIPKIATFANTVEDSLMLISLLSEFKEDKQKAIIIGMGKNGRIVRLTGHILGNYLIYAAISKGKATANGQMTVAEIKKIITF